MKSKRKPRKPHPGCVWNARSGVWVSPDDRTPARRKADAAIAAAAESSEWEKHGFGIVRSFPPSRPRKSRARPRNGRRTA